VNLGREGSLPSRRRALALTGDPLIVEKAFTDLRERFDDRDSGYTRLTHLGRRVGDGAPVMLVELVEGKPAQAKPESATAAPAGGVRGIAQRLRRGGGEAKPEPATPEEKGAAKAARVAERAAAEPKAKAPQAKPAEKPKAALQKTAPKPKAKAEKKAEKPKAPAAKKKPSSKKEKE
jgi:large subunit ribosomal protein L17